MSRKSPNILFIIADQWRADCLGFDHHPTVETPHLDHLFFHGTHFRQAYSSVPTCVAARASIMTGLSPRSHGRVGYADDVPWNYPVTLPRLLTQGGYQTCCVGKLHVCPERNRIGFEEVILHDGWLAKQRADRHPDSYDDYAAFLRRHAHADANVQETGLHVNSWVTKPWPYAEHLHPTNWAVSEAIRFLRRRDPTTPFFLNLSLVRPHPPFDPPESYLAMYRDKALPPIPVGDWRQAADLGRGGLNYEWTRGEVSADQLDRARRAYYALITQIDYQLNRLFMALEENGVADDTIILFVSDHGEMLGDHHYHAKALPFDGSARVPWLMRFPRSWNLPGQQVIDTPVELRDILPTLAECAGLPIPSTVEGRSVLPLLRGKKMPERLIEGEHARGNDEASQWLTDGRTKYIWFSESGRELLFDLESDPQELHDLATREPQRLQEWRERLIAQIASYEEGFVRDGQLVPGRPLRNVLDFLRESQSAEHAI